MHLQSKYVEEINYPIKICIKPSKSASSFSYLHHHFPPQQILAVLWNVRSSILLKYTAEYICTNIPNKKNGPLIDFNSFDISRNQISFN